MGLRFLFFFRKVSIPGGEELVFLLFFHLLFFSFIVLNPSSSVSLVATSSSDEDRQDSKSEKRAVISFRSVRSDFALWKWGVAEGFRISAASDPDGGDLKDRLYLLARSSLSRLSLFSSRNY